MYQTDATYQWATCHFRLKKKSCTVLNFLWTNLMAFDALQFASIDWLNVQILMQVRVLAGISYLSHCQGEISLKFGILRTRKTFLWKDTATCICVMCSACLFLHPLVPFWLCRNSDFMVGKMKKYDGFVDYARKALKKLKLHESPVCLRDELLEKYYQKYLSRKLELQRLLQVRPVDRTSPCYAKFTCKSYTVYPS